MPHCAAPWARNACAAVGQWPSRRPSTVSMLAPSACAVGNQAGAHLLAVEQHRAGAAVAGLAADLGAGEAELLAQRRRPSEAKGAAATLSPARPFSVNVTDDGRAQCGQPRPASGGPPPCWRRAGAADRASAPAPRAAGRRPIARMSSMGASCATCAGANQVRSRRERLRRPARPPAPAAAAARPSRRRPRCAPRRCGLRRRPRSTPPTMTMEMTRYRRAPSLRKWLRVVAPRGLGTRIAVTISSGRHAVCR